MCPGDLNDQFIGETERKLLVRTKKHVNPTNIANILRIMHILKTIVTFIFVLKLLKF